MLKIMGTNIAQTVSVDKTGHLKVSLIILIKPIKHSEIS